MSALRKEIREFHGPDHGQSAVGQELHGPFTVRPWMLLGAGLVLLLSLASGYLFGHREVGPLEQNLQAAQDQASQSQSEVNRLLALQPKCDDAKSTVAQVSDFVGRGSLDLASGLAETKLAQQSPLLCDDAGQALSELWYNASMDALFATPRPDFPNNALDQQLVAHYLEIERQADAYGIVKEKRFAAMSIAGRAYSAGLWALSDAAFRRAWAADQAGDAPVSFRYALLRNWGYYLKTKGGPAALPLAVRVLATAQAIADRYNLTGQNEACSDLNQLGYVDCHNPTPDTTDPVLLAAPAKTGDR